jgi:hypothetical protein
MKFAVQAVPVMIETVQMPAPAVLIAIQAAQIVVPSVQIAVTSVQIVVNCATVMIKSYSSYSMENTNYFFLKMLLHNFHFNIHYPNLKESGGVKQELYNNFVLVHVERYWFSIYNNHYILVINDSIGMELFFFYFLKTQFKI